ncbi:hypothetical protein BCR34DRAFT_598373 [Clohesyomyces aquaticus]|uniref:Uncharacterized protein n=1 Tax=Clohesyomyces aquaticus TaxID=1231657 RepID=A0A1Y1ZYR7_9PLEO|nr:hypothetical protein BCR34DRAFT_598373 [Clohesyomyces aquaticus]
MSYSASYPMSCDLKDSNTVAFNGDLHISFRRTVRVPDNKKALFLPPALGGFPLESESRHADKLPTSMVAEGSVFVSMYQTEAMWIDFKCKRPYMIKIYAGGINVISGEPVVETAATRLRRLAKHAAHKDISAASPLQDYFTSGSSPPRWKKGQIKQVIRKDPHPKSWVGASTMVFNVQILNSYVYELVTGARPQTRLMGVEQYYAQGLPFFSMCEEPSGISGSATFAGMKSVLQLEKFEDEKIKPAVIPLTSNKAPIPAVGLTNPNGPLREFRTVADLEKQFASYNTAVTDLEKQFASYSITKF